MAWHMGEKTSHFLEDELFVEFRLAFCHPRSTPRLSINKQHRINNPHHNTEANPKCYPREHPDCFDHNWRIGFNQIVFELATIEKLFIFCWFITLELIERHTSGEDDDIHRELLWPKVRVEEMHREDKSCGEQSFVAVNYRRNIKEQSR